jgi:hypothetical protein
MNLIEHSTECTAAKSVEPLSFVFLIVYSLTIPLIAVISMSHLALKLVLAIIYTVGIPISSTIVYYFNRQSNDNLPLVTRVTMSIMLIFLFVSGTVVSWIYYVFDKQEITILMMIISLVTCLTMVVYDVLLIIKYNPGLIDHFPDNYGSIL